MRNSYIVTPPPPHRLVSDGKVPSIIERSVKNAFSYMFLTLFIANRLHAIGEHTSHRIISGKSRVFYALTGIILFRT